MDDTDTLVQAADNEMMVNLTHATGEDDAGDQEDDEHVTKVDGIETARINLGHSAQRWLDLVATISHLMAFHKCCWQMLAWIGVEGRLVPRTCAQTPGDIHLTDNHGIWSKIEYKASDKPNIGLGFSLAPLGLQEPEFLKHLEEAKSCAAAMTTA